MKNESKKNIIKLAVTVILIAAAIIYLESTKVKVDNSPVQAVEQKEGKYPLAPELQGISGYINTDNNISISQFKGKKVVLADFWTYSCVNCIRTLPYLVSWDKKYRDDGLVIIGVHSPEFEFEKDYNNVLAAVRKYGIEYPVVQDKGI